MRYIESDSKDPYFNLALEEYVFDRLPREESWFMLWQNANSIIIGKETTTANTDLNGDGRTDVSDVVKMVSLIFGSK